MHAGIHSPAIASWHVPLSDADFQTLKAGFQPRGMEDRWKFLSCPDDDTRASHTQSDGTRDPAERLAVHIIRSWLRREFYRLHIVGPAPGGPSETTPGALAGKNTSATTTNPNARIEAITWDRRLDEPELEVSERQAMLRTVVLARAILGCTLEAIPELDFSAGWE